MAGAVLAPAQTNTFLLYSFFVKHMYAGHVFSCIGDINIVTAFIDTEFRKRIIICLERPGSIND